MIEFLHIWFPEILFIAKGLLINLQYTFISVFIGLFIAVIIAFAKVSKSKVASFLAGSYASFFRSTPLMIQLSIIYYVLPGLLGVKISVFTAAVISFSLNSGAYVSEIIRSGINSIDKGQFEAAKALGLSERNMMIYIILPQAVRKILPALINELINMLKETAIISIIGEAEILRRAQMVASQHYNYLVPMLTAACCYYIVVLSFVYIAGIVERKLAID